jgi:hypothetical protein
MTDDRHTPTTAAPSPEPTPAPTPTVTVVASTPTRPPGTAADPPSELPFGIPPDRPEILVGAAFAGGLVAAFILRRLGGD